MGSLCLDYCTNLFRIHDSVGFLDKLVLLSAKECIQLESLVPCMNLPSLETLDLRGCSRLASFPEVLGVMENLKDVYLDETNLYQLPFTIGNLVGLKRLFLRSCQCQRMIQIPSYVLPKVEIVISYHGRGVRSSNDAAKVSPKVSANAMCVYNEYGKSFLNVYSLNVSSNNVIEVCSPSWNQDEHKLKNMGYSLFCDPIHRGRVIMDKVRSKEPSVHFSFRKKFPRIALCCHFETGERFYNTVLDFKLNVLINGTKQLSTSCVYMFCRERKTDQKFFCDLQCNMDGIFSENEWNHVEISCELEHLMPCDYEWAWTDHDWNTKRILKWFVMHVYKENNEDDFNLVENPDFPLSSEQKFQEMQRRLKRLRFIQLHFHQI